MMKPHEAKIFKIQYWMFYRPQRKFYIDHRHIEIRRIRPDLPRSVLY